AAGIGDELRVAAGAVVVELRERTVVRGDDRVGGCAVVVEREHAAAVVDDDGVAGRAGVVEVQIVVVDEAWRERGIVDDTRAVDVKCDSRAARYEVKGGRTGGELDRIDRSVIGNRRRGRSAVVGERRRVVGYVRGRAPIRAIRPLGSRAGPRPVDRMCGGRGQR